MHYVVVVRWLLPMLLVEAGSRLGCEALHRRVSSSMWAAQHCSAACKVHAACIHGALEAAGRALHACSAVLVQATV
jgi:hypothetical protein